MASMASHLIEEVTAHAQSDSLEDAREIRADGTYFLNNLRIYCKFPIHCVIFTTIAAVSSQIFLLQFDNYHSGTDV